MLDPDDFARVAAEPRRLAVLGVLALAGRSAEEVAAATDMTPAAATRVLGRLVAGGLVTLDGGVYRLDTAALRGLVRSLQRPPAADPAVLEGVDEEDAAVAARFFRGRRLVEIPAAESRRRSVLRVLAEEFEPGRYYSEAEVRRVLRHFHPDDASLRRHLVDEGLLTRSSGTRTYWRGGGPPPPAGV